MNYSSRIKVFAPNIVRITRYLHSEGVPANRPWFEDVILPLSEQEKHGNPVKAEINNFLVQMVDQDGKCFFSEKKTARLNLRKSRPYLYFDIPQTAVNAGMHKVDHGIRLNINVHQDESFYGWGEWFNGFERKIGNFCLDNRNEIGRAHV